LTVSAQGVPTLSIVVPVYNEAAGLDEFYRRLTSVLADLGSTYEVVLVDDGSRDESARIMARLCDDDPRWRRVHFSRNFGHQAAVAGGLKYATGAAVVVMDADLQDPPELLEQMVARWREGYQVVYAQRLRRTSDPRTKRFLAYAYYRLLHWLATVELPNDTADFCLMDRRVVDLLNQMPERNRYIRGLRAWVGFRQTAVPYERPERFAGAPQYTFAKSLRLGLNGIFSLSSAPLRLATWLGIITSGSSFLLAVVYVIQKLTVGGDVRGWTSTVVIILFLGGVQLLSIGIIGEYLSRIYEEVKQRPLFVVSETGGFTGHEAMATVDVTAGRLVTRHAQTVAGS
jgi:polyisoprenyl-phosphate glycosyltransferase